MKVIKTKVSDNKLYTGFYTKKKGRRKGKKTNDKLTTNMTNIFHPIYVPSSDTDDSSILSIPNDRLYNITTKKTKVSGEGSQTRGIIQSNLGESPENRLGRLSVQDGNGQCDRLGITMEQFGSMIGLCAIGEMRAELFLGRYIGEKITTRNEMEKRMKLPGGYYMADLDNGKTWIDAKNKGNVLRFMNHHCKDYNCELRLFEEEDGTISLGIWTIKNIKNDEALYFNYGEQNSKHIGIPIRCLCAGVDNITGLPICKKQL